MNPTYKTAHRTPETDLAGVVFLIRKTTTNNHRFGRHARLFSRQELDYLGIEESIYREIVAP
jgi:hypothetical protein